MLVANYFIYLYFNSFMQNHFPKSGVSEIERKEEKVVMNSYVAHGTRRKTA